MKILILTPRFPLPTWKGDKLRVWQILRKLSSEHEIQLLSYISRSEEKYFDEVSKFCEIKTVPEFVPDRIFETFRGIGSGWPFQVHAFSSRRMMQMVEGALSDVDAVHLSTVRMAGNLPPDLPHKIIVDFIDALSLNFKRRYDNARTPLKYLYGMEYGRLSRFENLMVEKSDLSMAVGPVDADALGKKVEILPNSVDLENFNVPPEDQPRENIIFTGNLSYTPNIEAVETMAQRVMPVVNEKFPDIVLRLVGITPHARVKALESKNVKVVGFVDSLADEIGKSSIAAAPMVSGSGLQNKILEAMACATPVVSSSIGNAGIKAVHAENILIGDTPEEFAAQIIELLHEPEKARSIGVSGRKFVEDNFGWESTRVKLLDLYSEINK